MLEGSDYVYPRTSNTIVHAFLEAQGVSDGDILENYTPFGFSDWQTKVAKINKFGSASKKTAVVATTNGDANAPFYKEPENQNVKATDIPVIAFSVGEEELAGVDTKPLVDLGAVSKAMIGQKVCSPSGFDVVMGANDHMAKPVMIGEVHPTASSISSTRAV